jgi:hypothetical protein
MTNLLAQAINCDDADRAAETADPRYADERNFYKVEQWTRDGQHIDRLLFAGNNLDQAEAKFAAFAIPGNAPASSMSGPSGDLKC